MDPFTPMTVPAVEKQRPFCKTTFYSDPDHPNNSNKQVFLHCFNVGSDGRSLDDVISQTAYVDPNTGCVLSFDDLARQITRIFVQNSGDVTVGQKGFAGLPNLQELDIGCNENNFIWNLSINQNEFEHTPNLKILSLRSLVLSAESISAVTSLKNQLISVRFLNVAPGLKVLKILETFSKLKHIHIKNIKDTVFPPTIFRGSTNQLTWITLESCIIPKITDEMFAGMQKLLKLEVSDSNTEYVEPNAFNDLVDLRELSLADNKIRSFPNSLFSNMKMLTRVDLSGNCLEDGAISRNHFDQSENLIKLDV